MSEAACSQSVYLVLPTTTNKSVFPMSCLIQHPTVTLLPVMGPHIPSIAHWKVQLLCLQDIADHTVQVLALVKFSAIFCFATAMQTLSPAASPAFSRRTNVLVTLLGCLDVLGYAAFTKVSPWKAHACVLTCVSLGNMLLLWRALILVRQSRAYSASYCNPFWWPSARCEGSMAWDNTAEACPCRALWV